MEYRREIDGLRALAVLPVMLFHAGFETFSGGFVGVDVFFVISGYLITTLILAELEQGEFSIVRFYERRARRILPALFVVMLACLPAAWLWLLPGDMKEFSHSLMSVSVFASNILFWRESGYFDTAAELKPLLHTWSLAVEEQYYVLFPIFLILFWRLGKRRIFILLGVAFVASLSAAQWGSLVKPTPAFFLLPTRGWELLIGAFAAFYLSRGDRSQPKRGVSELGGCLGIGLITYAIFAYGKATPFPGLYALVPTCGTVLVILCATRETAIGKFVGNKAFVGIGLISYSAYLWHQPLFAFARHRSLSEPSPAVFAVLSVTALVLAYFSWRYVETLFRSRANFDRAQIFLYALVGSGFFVGLGFLGHLSDNVHVARPNMGNAAELDSSRIAPNPGLSAECDDDSSDSRHCITHENPEVLVWGDSYAMHLVQGLVASNPEIRLIQKTVSMCGPIADIAPISPVRFVRSWSERCLRANEQVFDYLKKTPSIKYVVMSSMFGQYVNKDATVLTKEGTVVSGPQVSYPAILSTIQRIKELGKTPVVFSPTPQNGENIGRCVMKAMFLGADRSVCDVRLADSYAQQAHVYDFLKQVEQVNPVVWLNEGLCSSDACKASFDGVFVYSDGGHLSHEGSAYLGKKMNFYGRLRKAAGSIHDRRQTL